MFEEEVVKQLIFIPFWFIAYSVFFLCKPASLGMSSILTFFFAFISHLNISCSPNSYALSSCGYLIHFILTAYMVFFLFFLIFCAKVLVILNHCLK